MPKYSLIGRRRKMVFSVALALLVICGLLAALTPGATAAVTLLYFRATAGSDSILVEWETATELDTAGFNLYRSENSGQKGQQIGNTFVANGDPTSGAKYSYADTSVVKGVRYYYSLEEIAASDGSLEIIATANAGIGVAPPIRHHIYLPVVLR
jgi:hypothetical protein